MENKGILQQIQESKSETYNPSDFTFKGLEDFFNNYSKQPYREPWYPVSYNGMRLINAELKGDKEESKRINEEITNDLDNSQKKNEQLFIDTYGQEMYDFITSLPLKKYWTITTHFPAYLSWDCKSGIGLEEDDYEHVVFYKGVFSHKHEFAGGYGGNKTIKDNLTQEEVKELVNI